MDSTTYILKYLNGEMSDDEKLVFEEEIKKDTTMQNELKAIKNIIHSIELSEPTSSKLACKLTKLSSF